MFRLSNLIKATFASEELRTLNGNIAIWNLTNRCNLHCLHCYSKASLDSDDLLNTQKIFSILDDFADNKIKFVIFSGGEPLVRKDIFEIAKYAKQKGIVTYLSSNGLYINKSNAKDIVENFNYIGVSIDGDEESHDYFRGLKGSFKKSIEGMKYIQEAGGKVGIRFTMTKTNIQSLPFIFALSKKEGFAKIYLSHLVYSGRGAENVEIDLSQQQRKDAVDFIIQKAFEYYKNGDDIEIVTGNMECDAISLLNYFEKNYPQYGDKLLRKLKSWGGNSAGNKLFNLDSFGNVKPDPFFPKVLGNIFQNPFGEIWNNTQNELLNALKKSPRILEGKCSNCKYLEICNGGSRSRAFAVSGNLWAEDPSCYLSNEEIV